MALSERQVPGINDASHCAVAAAHVADMEGVTGVVTMTLLGEPEKANGLLGIVLAKESGQIDIQYVKKKWALPQPEESDKLHSILLQSF